jgi:hypothetical protein
MLATILLTSVSASCDVGSPPPEGRTSWGRPPGGGVDWPDRVATSASSVGVGREFLAGRTDQAVGQFGRQLLVDRHLEPGELLLGRRGALGRFLVLEGLARSSAESFARSAPAASSRTP